MPSLAALDDAMLRPGRSVPGVNRLGGGTITMEGPGRPWRLVGTDAVVYQLRQPTGRVLALRCPLLDTPPRTFADRYRGLGSDPAIKKLRERPESPLVDDIVYLADGLLLPAPDLRSASHPVVGMAWVTGATLLAAVDSACCERDAEALIGMAEAWRRAMDALASAGVVHGDLTATNAIVRPDESIALVDYDTCVWPGAPQVEEGPGTPGTAHPQGSPRRSPERRDHFPALVIYASLLVLARYPGLRADHGDPPDIQNGTLLFSAQDLADPAGSVLFAGLLAEDDPLSGPIVRALQRACLSPAAETPRLTELVPPDVQHSRPRRARTQETTPDEEPVPSGPAPTPSPPRLTPLPPRGPVGDSTDRMAAQRPSDLPAVAPGKAPGPTREVAAAQRERQRHVTHFNSLLLVGDEEGAYRYWHDSGLAEDADAVQEMGPRIAQIERGRALRRARAAATASDTARVRRDGMGRLKAALDAGDTATIATLWPEVRKDPLAAALTIRVLDALKGVFGTAFAAAVERKDDAAIVAAMKDAQAAGISVAPAERRAARAASERLKARKDLERALAADDRPALASLTMSGRLTDLGSLEPRVSRAALRALAWPELQRAMETGDDAAMLAAFDPELFGSDDALSPAQRRRIDEARARQGWLEQTRTALRKRDASTLQRLLREAPIGAVDRLRPVERRRVERLVRQGVALERLTAALRDGPDEAIVAALSDVESAGATLPESLDWALVRGVVDRLTLVAAIRRAAADPPDYARLARLLPTARALAGDHGDLGAGLDLARLEGEVLRAAQLARLREAIAADDDGAIVAVALPDAYGALMLLGPEERARLERALIALGGDGASAGVGQDSGSPRSRRL